MSSPPPKSSVPATMPTVWPPSNPSGTVIPFPLPWGQTGCCPPGGMDALMKCYCDIQQASAFIGQVMLDQINNNPAITEAIIAAIEKSGSSVPLIGVTDGSNAQPGQVGEFVQFPASVSFPVGNSTTSVTMGVLQPGDWDIWAFASATVQVATVAFDLSPPPVGVNPSTAGFISLGTESAFDLQSTLGRASITVPTLFAFSVVIGSAVSAGSLDLDFCARRAR